MSAMRPTVARVRRFFYDTEFIEDGTTIDLVSIGVVDETGREFYAVSTEFDERKAIPWVRRNVLDQLPSPADKAWRSRERIRDDLLAFLTGPGEEIELWAWFAAYDHVALCQLWGAMPALPRPIPRFTRELRQRWDDLGQPPCRPSRTAPTTRSSTPATTWCAGRRWRPPGDRRGPGSHRVGRRPRRRDGPVRRGGRLAGRPRAGPVSGATSRGRPRRTGSPRSAG